jgi:hypothetical protein
MFATQCLRFYHSMSRQAARRSYAGAIAERKTAHAAVNVGIVFLSTGNGTMKGSKRSQSGAASSSERAVTADTDAAPQWRFERSTFACRDAFYEAVLRAQSNGRSQYWKKVVVVKTDNGVVLECKLCGKERSAKNPSDSAGSHILALPDGRNSCKEAKKRQGEVDGSGEAGSHSRLAKHLHQMTTYRCRMRPSVKLICSRTSQA